MHQQSRQQFHSPSASSGFLSDSKILLTTRFLRKEQQLHKLIMLQFLR